MEVDARPPDVVLVLGGGPLHQAARSALGPTALVVAADSGVDHALAAGLRVHHVVGDLDSASAAAVARAEESGATVHRHQADKDATDSELAIDLALALAWGSASPADGAPRAHLLVVGGGADRLDHLLADVAQLVSERLADVEVTAVLGAATCTVVRAGRPRLLTGLPGDQVSLLVPVGPAIGVTTTDLRWPLLGAELAAASTRGVSNEMLGATATVSVEEGVVLVVRPGTIAPTVAPRATPYDPSPGAPAGA